MEPNPLTEPFNLHLLFDAYIAHNIGNDRMVALNKFTEAISIFFQKQPDLAYMPLIYLLNLSSNVQLIASMVIDTVAELNRKTKDSIRRYQDKEVNATVRKDLEEYLSKTFVETLGKLSKSMQTQNKISQKNMAKYIQELDNMQTDIANVDFKEHTPNKYMYMVISKFVEMLVSNFDSLIIPGGYRNTNKEQGHLIGLYYEQSKLVVTNSGSGVNNHSRDDQGRYEVILEKNDVSDDAMIKLLTENYIARGIFDADYDIEKYYSTVLQPVFGKSFTSDYKNDAFFHDPQLSGSCTFFGLYYILYYLYNSRQKLDHFNQFIEYTKLRVADEIIDNMNRRKRITDNDKNYLDMLHLVIKGRDKQIQELYEKYVKNVTEYTDPKQPQAQVVSTDHKFTDKSGYASDASDNTEYKVYSIDEVMKLNDLNAILNKLVDILTGMEIFAAGWRYIILVYTILKILTSIYKKDELFSNIQDNISIMTFMQTITTIFTLLNKKFDKSSNIDKSISFYKISHVEFILLNIIIKVNRSVADNLKFLTEGKYDSINNIIVWINNQYKISSLFDVPMYDFAENIKNYQQYIPTFSQHLLLPDNFSFSDEFIEAWGGLASKLPQKATTATVLSALNLFGIQIRNAKNSADLYKLLKDKTSIMNFLTIISSSYYYNIFKIFMRLFVTKELLKWFSFYSFDEQNQTVYKIAINRTRFKDNLRFISPTEKLLLVPTNFYNDINVVEIVNNNNNSIDEVNQALENFVVINDNGQNKNLLNSTVTEDYKLVETSQIRQDILNLYEFDFPEYTKSYKYHKCLLSDIKTEDFDKLSPKAVSVILLLDYMCHKKLVADVKKLAQIINELEIKNNQNIAKDEEITKLYLSRQVTYQDYNRVTTNTKNVFSISIRLKILYMVMTNSYEYLKDVAGAFYELCTWRDLGRDSSFINSHESVYYQMLLLHIIDRVDILKRIAMYEIASSNYAKLFLELLRSRNIEVVEVLGIANDKLFGELINYNIKIADTVHKISLIDRDVFKNFAYNKQISGVPRVLYDNYHFYLDHTDNKINAIAYSSANLPDLQVAINSDNSGFTVSKKNTTFEKVATISGGLYGVFEDKFSGTDYSSLIWYDSKAQIIQIQLIEYGMTFEIRSDNKMYFNNEYEVLTTKANFCYNKWIYDIPNSFLLTKNNKYKILLLDINDTSKDLDKRAKMFGIEKLLGPVWINSHRAKFDYPDKVYKEFSRPKYYIIDFHYTSLYLIFSTEDSLRSYIYYCAVYSKTNCLFTLHNQYIQYYLANNTRTSDYLFHFFANTPFKYYFMKRFADRIQNVSSQADFARASKFDEYTDFDYNYNAREQYYPPRFKIVTKTDYKPVSYKVTYDRPLQVIQKNLLIETPFEEDKNTISQLSSIDSQYTTYLLAFVQDYKNCKLLSNTIDSQKAKNLKYIFNSHINSLLEQQSKEFNNVTSQYNFIDFIYNNYQRLYKLMEYIKMLTIVESIELICSLGSACECHEIRRLRDILDSNVLYTGERYIPTVLFEILFGSFIRKDQYSVYLSILNDFHSNNYRIYQMLMGEGKTSVLAPLLTFTFIINRQFPNIILTMPEHLISQSYDTLITNYSVIMDSCNMLKLKVDREDNKKLQPLFSTSTETRVQLLLVDDGSFKAIKLNEAEFGPILTETIRDKSVNIVDEIDSIMDPLSSELNYPLDYKKIRYFVSDILVYFVRKILVKSDFKKINLSSQAESETIVKALFKDRLLLGQKLPYANEFNYFDSKTKTGSIDFSVVGYIKKIYSTLITSLLMIYNKDYGFGRILDKYQKNHMLAIPYKAVNDPVDKSEYTDSELTVCLTIFTYYYHGLRQLDLVNIVTFISSLMNKYKYQYLLDLFLRDLKDILAKYGFNLTDVIQDRRQEFFDSLQRVKFDYDLIDFYLKSFVIPKYVEITNTQLNTSFIDAITAQFCKYKIAFSGTVNIQLPKLVTSDHEFKGVVDSNKANGSIISAVTGFVNKNKLTYVDKNTPLQLLFDMILKNNYNVVVDVGAFFKDYTALEFVTQLAKYTGDKRKYIFIDENDTKQVYENTKIYPYNNIVYPTEELFIYYDNKHIVGVDIKQPYHLKVVVTISWNDTLTKVGQGIFRARNTNYGHFIDFFIDTTVQLNGTRLTTTIDLLRFLYQKEREHVENSLDAHLLQNIKYLRRYTAPFKRESYLDTVFNGEVQTEEDLAKNLYAMYIKSNYCQDDNKLTKDLCDTLFNRLDKTTTNVKQDTQQQKALATAKEVVVEVALEKAVSTRKIEQRPDMNKSDLTNYKTIIDNYLNLTGDILVRPSIQQYKSIEYLKKNMIYVSVLLLTEIISNSRKFSEQDFYNYNYYYIKYIGKEIKYLLITPAEFFSVFMYLNVNKDSKTAKKYNIIIKHKFGHVKFIEAGVTDVVDSRELLAQLFLAKKLKRSDYLQIFDAIVKEKSYDDFGGLVFVDMPNIYGYKILDTEVINFFMDHKDKYKDELLKLCKEDSIDKLLKVLDINISSSSLSSQEKQLIILNNDLTNNDLVSCTKLQQTGGVYSHKKYRLKKRS